MGQRVRVGVIWSAVEPMPGVYDDAYIDRVKATMAMLARHGGRSLVDFPQDLYNQRFQGEGAPDWAVQDDGLPTAPLLGFPGNYVGLPAFEADIWPFLGQRPGARRRRSSGSLRGGVAPRGSAAA